MTQSPQKNNAIDASGISNIDHLISPESINSRRYLDDETLHQRSQLLFTRDEE